MNSYDKSVIAEYFKQTENRVEKIKAGSYNKAIPYLVHRNAPEKFQYDPEDVKANFDYVEFIKEYDKKQNKVSLAVRLAEIQKSIGMTRFFKKSYKNTPRESPYRTFLLIFCELSFVVARLCATIP